MKNRLTVLVLISCVVMLSGCIESDSSPGPEVRYTIVKETPTPVQPRHCIPYDERHDPVYVNYGDDVDDHIEEVCSEFVEYMPVYMRGEVDCSDMAVYLWNKLQERGVKTILVLGSTDGEYTPFGECDHVWLRCLTPDAGYTIEPTTPAIIYNNGITTFRTSEEVDELMVSYTQKSRSNFLKLYDEMYPGAPSDLRELACEIWLECPESVEKHDMAIEHYKCRFIEDSSKTDKYSYGFYYAKPSDLRADVGDRW